MKRILVLCVAVLCHCCVYAQIQRGVIGEYDTEDFPFVSFIWNSPDPDIIAPTQFVVIENDERLDVDVVPLEPDYDNVPGANVLFLVEDMASHKGQTEFSKDVLDCFFSETSIKRGDLFNIAVFSRKEYSQNIITPLSPSFTDDAASLRQIVAEYTASKRYFSDYSNQTDLYLAINEGIEYLKKQSGNRYGVLVVISAGLNIKASGASTEMETVRRKALEAGVPVYLIIYPLFGDAPELSLLAEDTYGLACSTEAAGDAADSLGRYYDEFDKRISGQQYRITFKSLSPRDGDAHSISLFVDKVVQVIPQYHAPEVTLSVWIREHMAISVLLICLLLAIIGVTIWFIVSLNNKKKETIRRLRDEVLDVRSRQHLELEERVKKQKEQEEQIRREQGQKLLNDMQRRNLSPKLCYTSRGENLQYIINTVRTEIGRENDNDLVLPESTVSGHHAEILFNGEGFDIVDMGSTNGVKVNGCGVTKKELRNGDKIQLGEIIIVYFD